MTEATKPFRAGDVILHKPSNEKWSLACDEENGEVVCAGWPESYAKASDCEIVGPANDQERLAMLRDCANMKNDRGGDTLRGTRAARQLKESQ